MSRMTPFRLSILALLPAVVCGCITTRATRFADYPPRPPEHEIIIYSVTLPEQPYEEIGIVSSRRTSDFTSMEAVLESLKKEAREMGGDAIIGLTESTEAREVDADTGRIDSVPVLSGTVIRFLPEEDEQDGPASDSR